MKRFAFVAFFALSGCGGGKAAPPGPAATAAADSGYVDIGVPECDQYARKYLACLARVPEGSRAMVRQSFDQTRELWAVTAEKPERRAALASACAQQQKATEAGMSRYSCEW
jgi:hypothetical protein